MSLLSITGSIGGAPAVPPPSVGGSAYTLSNFGIVSDADLAMNSQGSGSNQDALIQSVLDMAAHSSGNTQDIINWDVAVATGGGLRVGSNTKIIGNAGCGAIMRPNSNRVMFLNKNPSWGGVRVEKNITVDGGIWHGNHDNQTEIGNPTYGQNNIFSWYGVNGLTMRNFVIRKQKVYSVDGMNILNGLYEDFLIDGGMGGQYTDGVHFDGWSYDCIVRRGQLRCNDDAVGINLDDSKANSNNVCYPFYPTSANGPGGNILVEDIELLTGSHYGVRVLSNLSRADDIIIRRVTGTTQEYAVLVDNFWREPSRMGDGTGDCGTITIEDIDVVVTGSQTENNKAVVSITCNIEELILNNISESGTSGIPSIWLDSHYTYGSVLKDGVTYTPRDSRP